jgi:signal transduction histidine kinase
MGPALQFVVPVVGNTQLVATFYRPPTTPWPLEILQAALVAIIVAGAAAAYFARRVARPLSQLARAASVIADGGPAPRLRENGPHDVRNAAIAFNAMTDQVTRTLESQRQLLSAVGHDLRTPITAMRISLEFVEDGELRERLQKNLDELQELTEAVLSSARGTGGEIKRNVDLSALLESICTDLDERGEPVTWKMHPPAPLSCRPNEIRRAVRNLVENAVAYGRRASVGLTQCENGYEILIEDEGPGIPEGDQGRVFEPFVRLEGSRNADTGGAGLGLTLVKAIAEGHGGAVTLENRANGGLRARLRLPREVAPA